MSWLATELCSDADVLGFESEWLNWTDETSAWRRQAKAVIEEKLRYNLREKELATVAADVLDLVGNTSALKFVACYKTLELCARKNMTNAADVWSEKARYYGWKFDQEIANALEMLSFDSDESGTVEDSEKYRLTGAVTFGRGGPDINDVSNTENW